MILIVNQQGVNMDVKKKILLFLLIGGVTVIQAQKNERFTPPNMTQKTHTFALPELQIDSTFITNLNTEYTAEGGIISSRGESAFSGEFAKAGLPMPTIIEANGGIPVALISNFGGDGLTVQTSNGTHSIIVGSKHPNGRAVTTGHEVIGHGRSLSLGRGQANQHIDAIRTENLILRVMVIGYINNGSNHGPRVIIPNPSILPGFR